MNPALASHPVHLPQDFLNGIHVVLSHTSHPGNIGATARAMKTMGLSRLTLVNPKRFPDNEATARAAGAEDILTQARVCVSLDEALTETVFAVAVSARHRSLGPEPMPVRRAVSEILEQTGNGDVALVFGNETSGLSNAEVQRCQRSVFIPANPDYSSLNLGSAVQLLCYELRLAAFNGCPPVVTKAVPFASPVAANDDVERFYAHLERVMIATGFLDPQQPKRLLPKLRRLFGRAKLENDEINILRGVLDAVEKAIDKTSEPKS
ncbi:RNA methyltransferase [Propionivibrio sp.]|uniref:RNA methyltransferase n=1 Tax=Propionivibrio sp. TaxID=2212460 RepID=UPI0025FB8198|nr:RNA methyltransferase [Propionivibrio sp.]MBK7356411.1 RNA methyltransferase [Propionivibrio sp.]MBK8400122.1 RNA methyltransferase [Propionivibrio sp.]MBK8744637.1 RNA methyltransferase [Propionivibrio sp.]MBK8893812.1 RNA methyltransferase [Propionivibrio sp.]